MQDLKYIDTHTHLHFEDFDEDRDDILRQMQKERVGAILVGTSFETSKEVVDMASKYGFLWCAIGQHPTDDEEFDAEQYKLLAGDMRVSKVVAIGECGLDYFRSTKEEAGKKQKELFEKQIMLALELNLPLMLHVRSSQYSKDAHDDVLDILTSYKKEFESLKIHMHFFTMNKEVAKDFLNIDASFGIPGVVTFAKEVAEAVEYIPISKILVESDAPYASPAPFRGRRNTPLYTINTLEYIAEVKNINKDKAIGAILQNSLKVFDPDFA